MASGYSTATAGAELVPEQVAALLIEPLLAEAVVLAAGPVIFDAEGAPVQVPKITALDLADPWRAENVAIAEADPAYSEVTLLPSSLKSLKVIHRVSNELARNAISNVANVLSNALVRRVANALDKAFLVGDGVAGTITGIANQTGVQTMAAVGVLSVDDLHDAHGLALSENAKPNAWFMHPRDLISLRKTKDTSGQYLVQPNPVEAGAFTLLGIPVYISTQIPADGGVGTNESTIVLADVGQVAVGRDLDVSVALLSERYADFDQVGIRVTARFDIGLLNAAGVTVLQGVTA